MVIAWRQNMSRNKRTFPAHFPAWGHGRRRTVVCTMPQVHPTYFFISHLRLSGLRGLLWAVCLGCLVSYLSAPRLAHADTAVAADQAPLSDMVSQWLQGQSQVQQPEQVQLQPGLAGPGSAPRVEVVLGGLDPRLKLAPCQKVATYMPQGMKLWGSTRVGLRCEQGPVRWNVFWPVTVKVWGTAVVLNNAVGPGHEIGPQDLKLAEVDLAESSSPAVLNLSEAIGRSAQRRLQPGDSLRQSDLRARRWFSAGDPVRLHVKGPGFMAASEGVALAHGDEGRCARVRTSQGRVVCAQPTAEGLAELTL